MTIWKNEAIYKCEPVGLYLFNLTTNKLEFLLPWEYGRLMSAFNYVESLVSIGKKNSLTSSWILSIIYCKCSLFKHFYFDHYIPLVYSFFPLFALSMMTESPLSGRDGVRNWNWGAKITEYNKPRCPWYYIYVPQLFQCFYFSP